jgi:hypothetical protein
MGGPVANLIKCSMSLDSSLVVDPEGVASVRLINPS